LINTWRGFGVKDLSPNKFDLGEVVYTFGEKDLTVTKPGGVQEVMAVSTIYQNTFILTKADNTTMAVAYDELVYLTSTYGIGMSSYGNGTSPTSFKIGITRNDTHSAVMWKCK